MNDKIGKYCAVVKILFLTFRQYCLLLGTKLFSFCPLKKAALPKRRKKYFDYSAVFSYFVIYTCSTYAAQGF